MLLYCNTVPSLMEANAFHSASVISSGHLSKAAMTLFCLTILLHTCDKCWNAGSIIPYVHFCIGNFFTSVFNRLLFSTDNAKLKPFSTIKLSKFPDFKKIAELYTE